MFKNIQKTLLTNNPLLWNLKIIPFAALALFIHIIFFIVGYINGGIDFTQNSNYYSSRHNEEITIFFGVLITILTFIVWLVFYSRNNAFKSFYPKNNFSLFKEWALILLICILNSTYTVSYLYAKDLKGRNYFTEQEINRRCEVLSFSSIFVDAVYEEGNYIDTIIDGQPTQIERDSFVYQNRRYSLKSLINKQMRSFEIFDSKKDSAMDFKVKNWLVENKKDSVQHLFNDFFKISNEHHLKSNITPNQWLDLVYDYPEYTKPITIGKRESESYYYENDYYDYDQTTVTGEGEYDIEGNPIIDSTSQVLKIVDGKKRIFAKYYVPFASLESSYSKIARSWENPDVDYEFLLIFTYLSIGLSIMIFSFKTTSGRNWLIALVSLGVIGIISGIATVLSYYEMTFPIIYLFVFLIVLGHFIVVLTSKTTKGISGITLNQLLWMFPAVLPIIYMIILEIMKNVTGYNNAYDYDYAERATKDFTTIEWMQDNALYMLGLNFLFIIICMIIFSFQIKKWKGIPEA